MHVVQILIQLFQLNSKNMTMIPTKQTSIVPAIITVSIFSSTIDFIAAISDIDKILQLLSVEMNIFWSLLFYHNNNHNTTVHTGGEPSNDNNSSQAMTNDESYRDINDICNCGGGSTANSILLIAMDANYVLKQSFKSFHLLAIIICLIQNSIDLKIKSVCIHDMTNHNFDITRA